MMWHRRGQDHGDVALPWFSPRRAVWPGSMVPVRAVVREQTASPFGGKGSPLPPTGTM
jgi:hypothetical protein